MRSRRYEPPLEAAFACPEIRGSTVEAAGAKLRVWPTSNSANRVRHSLDGVSPLGQVLLMNQEMTIASFTFQAGPVLAALHANNGAVERRFKLRRDGEDSHVPATPSATSGPN